MLSWYKIFLHQWFPDKIQSMPVAKKVSENNMVDENVTDCVQYSYLSVPLNHTDILTDCWLPHRNLYSVLHHW